METEIRDTKRATEVGNRTNITVQERKQKFKTKKENPKNKKQLQNRRQRP